jgi:hypothetical protein
LPVIVVYQAVAPSWSNFHLVLLAGEVVFTLHDRCVGKLKECGYMANKAARIVCVKSVMVGFKRKKRENCKGC